MMLKDDPTWTTQRISGTAQMPSSTPRRRPAKKDTELTISDQKGEPCLFGDLSEVKNLFKSRPRKSVTLGMARSIKAKVALEQRGLSGFLEGAILSFDGNLPALWTAAVHFCECRRLHAPEDSIENATARISWTAFERLEAIVGALVNREVAGVTRSRVLCGLVELRLRSEQTQPRKDEKH
ncbi:hypothetical protein [Geothrix sp. 21YS21S-2]|uniref:hypothetical protein n=1 Tax=Geothrix sp. 21YS21S-2 TaxID=3068893 RepID=UPI0027BA57DC|nr:hypothetical protein [Geothrix sp. 21YS21S-2]